MKDARPAIARASVRGWRRAVEGAVAAIAAAACGPEVPPSDRPVAWREEVAALFEVGCAECHGETERAGGYSVAGYLEAIGHAVGAESLAVAGDPDSPLLHVLDEASHRAALERGVEATGLDPDVVRRWVVDFELAYFRSDDHPPGILYPAAAEFHGRKVAASGWSMAGCRHCHGEDYGGDLGPTCLSCHPATPETCGTCHSGPEDPPPFRGLGGVTDPTDPVVGAHDVHVHGGEVSAGMPCGTCHPGRTSMRDAGHRDQSVRMLFRYVATAGGLAPEWDPTGRTCSDTWCHGAGLSDGAFESPPWDVPESTPCGTCHLVPPETVSSGGPHPDVETCGSCHGAVIDDAGEWVDPSRHVDGILDRGWP